MPMDGIATVQQHGAECKINKGIIFMDKDGNIIDNTNNDDDGTLENTGVRDHADQAVQDIQQNDYALQDIHKMIQTPMS